MSNAMMEKIQQINHLKQTMAKLEKEVLNEQAVQEEFENTYADREYEKSDIAQEKFNTEMHQAETKVANAKYQQVKPETVTLVMRIVGMNPIKIAKNGKPYLRLNCLEEVEVNGKQTGRYITAVCWKCSEWVAKNLKLSDTASFTGAFQTREWESPDGLKTIQEFNTYFVKPIETPKQKTKKKTKKSKK